MEKKMPEGWLAVAVIVLAHLILILAVIIISILFLMKPKEVEIEEPVFEEEPLSLEEMLEHDLAFKFAVWEYQQIDVEEVEEPEYLIDVTEEDIALMARVVMSEVGADRIDIDVKQAVAQTIVNRVRDGRWGTTVTEVVTYPNAYSTADNGEPTAECWDAVEAALLYEAFPLDMFYFRENHYHSFGEPYLKLGTTFFSTEKTAWD